jgi:hypothetical protein
MDKDQILKLGKTRQPQRFLGRSIDEIQARGHLTFTVDQLTTQGIERGPATSAALCRYARSGAIRRISRKSDFFLIVPPEYRQMGCPPVEWWIDEYMTYLDLPYRVGLLSAAAAYGSSHFALMEYQILIPTFMRPISIGRMKLHFFVKSTIDQTPAETLHNPWGKILVATKEATLLDLLRYRVANITRISLIAADLAPHFRPAELKLAMDAVADTPSAQRLGFLMEKMGRHRLADVIEHWLEARAAREIDLDIGGRAPIEIAKRWRVRVNAPIEVYA